MEKELNAGYERFCLYMDRLNLLVKEYKVITHKQLEKINKECFLVPGNEKHNLDAQVQLEVCHFVEQLMNIMKKSKLNEQDVQKYMQSKDYIYRVFFKSEYEPLVDTLEK